MTRYTLPKRNPKSESHQIVGIYEAAEYLGICYYTMRRLVKEGHIPCRNIGSVYMIRKDALDEYIRGTDFPRKTDEPRTENGQTKPAGQTA